MTEPTRLEARCVECGASFGSHKPGCAADPKRENQPVDWNTPTHDHEAMNAALESWQMYEVDAVEEVCTRLEDASRQRHVGHWGEDAEIPVEWMACSYQICSADRESISVVRQGRTMNPERRIGMTAAEQAEREEIIDALICMVARACTIDNGEGKLLDSMASATYAGSLRLLARLGKVEITEEVGRRIIARWKE